MTASQIQQDALTLPDEERARLAADLLESLPVTLSDTDDGSAEAQRRIAEMKHDPSACRTWGQIKAGLGR